MRRPKLSTTKGSSVPRRRRRIPHRYDMQINSEVNNEIQVFSTKLRTQQKVPGNAFLNLESDLFTRPGLHLNSKEKEQSAKKMVNIIKDILNKT